MEDKLYKIMSEIFRLDRDKITRESSIETIRQWTSLNHVVLIDRIEKEWDLNFEISEIINIKNVSDILDIIEKYTNGK